MDAFSYLSVLLSIIIGLAITEILQGYRRLLLASGRVKVDATALIWSLLLILFATQAWWASFGLRSHDEWSFLGFALILLQMILLYMMAAVILPEEGKDVDLGTHFDRHRKAFFLFLIGMLATSVVKDVVLDGRLPVPSNLAFHLCFAAMALVGVLVENRKVQLLLAIAGGVSFTIYVASLFARL